MTTLRAGALLAALLCVSASLMASQPAVSATDGWARVTDGVQDEASAFVAVANPTMYDVYLVGVSSEIAASAELWQSATASTKATVTKEVTVAAYDRLEMAPSGVHVRLRGLKRPLKAGDTVPLALTLEGGMTLTAVARVK